MSDLDKKIKELEVANEAIDRDIKVLLESQKVTHEQIVHFLKDSSYFTQKNWESLGIERKKMEDKLQTSLDQVLNVKTKRQKLKSLQTQPHWLFVK